MDILITYGSKYGSTKLYAEAFSQLTGYDALSYSEVKSILKYDIVVHFGALYAGGVLGLKHILSKLSNNTKLIIVTVGLADVDDAQNIKNIRKSALSHIPKSLTSRIKFFHLRGAIDYNKLSFKHQILMALLYAKAKRLPEDKKNLETQTMIETYKKQISFIDIDKLQYLIKIINM